MKITLKENFEGLPFPQKVRAYISLCRPFTGIGAFLAGVFLTIFATGQLLPQAFLVGFILMLLQFSGQSINQSCWEEIKIDILNGKDYRPVVRGLIHPNNAFRFGIVLNVIALWLAFGLNYIFGLWCVLISFFAVFYTLKPIRAKRLFLVNNLWQAISRGLLPIIAVWALYNPILQVTPWVIGMILALWVFGAQTTKDFGDKEGDKAYGIRTLPVVLGKNGAIWLSSFAMELSFALLITLSIIGIIEPIFLSLIWLIIPSYVIIWAMKKEVRIKPLENSLSWNGFYMTLGFWFAMLGAVGWVM